MEYRVCYSKIEALLKILQIIQKPQLRGVEIFTCQLSNHLIAIGHEVTVLSVYPGDAILPFKGKLKTLNRPLSLRRMDFKGWKLLAKYISKENPDIVQANAGDTLKYAALSKLIFRWKAPIIFRNASVVSAYIRSAPVLLYNRILYKQVSHVISVSHHSKNDLEKLFPFLENKTTVIPIGVELHDANISTPDINYILHVGGFTFEKNHEGLLRIFSSLLAENPNLELWLIGNGPLRTQLEAKVNFLNLSSKVRFLGAKMNVTELMKSAKVLVLPSIIEGLPAVILEAFSQKTPVVAYDVGGISEVLTEETGWLVNAGDEPKFAKAVIETMNPSESKIRTGNAYTLVKESFQNLNIASRFLSVYNRINEARQT
jgi:glycosyltransferase involved in cell wall biosynthesis